MPNSKFHLPFDTVFFGSTTDSVLVLDRLTAAGDRLPVIRLLAVVTQPPRPIGRKQVLTRTPVHQWADVRGVPVLHYPSVPEKPWLLADEQSMTSEVLKLSPTLLVSASYGQKIPARVIESTQFGGLNVHPSILPRWRGGDPVPWAILAGDENVGVSLMEIHPEIDQGTIITQISEKMPENALSNEIRTHLFSIGADLLVQHLASDRHPVTHTPAPLSPGIAPTSATQTAPVARRFDRRDGFIPAPLIGAAAAGTAVGSEASIQSLFNALPVIRHLGKYGIRHAPDVRLAAVIGHMVRALSPWPGVWTVIRQDDRDVRVKILDVDVVDGRLTLNTVQPDGKLPQPPTPLISNLLRISPTPVRLPS